MNAIARLDALSRERELTLAESLELERAMKAKPAPIRAAPVIAPGCPQRWNRGVAKRIRGR